MRTLRIVFAAVMLGSIFVGQSQSAQGGLPLALRYV
jgi:hypothetical protein